MGACNLTSTTWSGPLSHPPSPSFPALCGMAVRGFEKSGKGSGKKSLSSSSSTSNSKSSSSDSRLTASSASSYGGLNGSTLRKSHTERSARLASVLATRLSYASLKVSRGWVQQNINEVENLYSSRFRHQAEERALKGSRSLKSPRAKPQDRHQQHHSIASQWSLDVQPLTTASANPYMAGSIGNGGMAVFPSSSGPDEQPRAYFADARNDQDHIYSFVPSEAYADVPRRYSDTIVLSSTDAATPPPLQQPSPSMYAYLASPIIGNLQSPAVHSRASFSSAPHQPMASISESASASAPDTDSSATPIPLFPDHPIHRAQSAQTEVRGGTHAFVPHHQPPSTQTFQSTARPTVFSPQDKNLPPSTSFHAHVGAPSLHVRQPSGLLVPANFAATPKTSSTSGFAGQATLSGGDSFSFPALPGSPAVYGANSSSNGPPHSQHKRNFSNGIRGDYSMSNVTMDDLDSHFGSG